MKRFTAVGIVFLLFLTGVVVGVVGTHAFYLHHVREPDQLIDLGSRWHVRKLRRELELTAEQEAVVGRLVRETRAEIRELREEVMPRVRSRIESAHEEFVATLNPAQRERLEELMRRHGRRYERAFGLPVGGEHGPGHRGHGARGHGRSRHHGRAPDDATPRGRDSRGPKEGASGLDESSAEPASAPPR